MSMKVKSLIGMVFVVLLVTGVVSMTGCSATETTKKVEEVSAKIVKVESSSWHNPYYEFSGTGDGHLYRWYYDTQKKLEQNGVVNAKVGDKVVLSVEMTRNHKIGYSWRDDNLDYHVLSWRRSS